MNVQRFKNLLKRFKKKFIQNNEEMSTIVSAVFSKTFEQLFLRRNFKGELIFTFSTFLYLSH